MEKIKLKIHKVVQKWLTRAVQIVKKMWVSVSKKNVQKTRKHLWQILIRVFCILYNCQFTYCGLHI